MASALNTFNWIASFYDRLTSLVYGSTLIRAQLAFVDSIGNADAVLIVGGGSGKFLEALLQRKKFVSVCYVEASHKMLSLTKKRIGTNQNVTFIHGTEDDIPGLTFDVVITSFFLDLFPQNQLEEVVEKIERHLDVGGQWIVTDFENSPRLDHRVLLRLMYFFFYTSRSIRATQLPDWKSIFEKKRFSIIGETVFKRGFIKSALYLKAI